MRRAAAAAVFLVAMIVGAEAAPGWRTAEPLEFGRAYLAAASLKDDIYVVGGGGILGPRNDVDAYDVVADHWRPMTPLPEALERFGLAAGPATLFISGGLANEGRAVSEVWKMTPGVNSRWTPLPSLPAARAGHAMVWINDALYIIGGLGENADRILRLGVDDEDWRVVGRLPESRSDIAAVAVGRDIYAIGGLSKMGGASRRVDVFDTRAGEVRRGPSLPDGRAGHVAANLGGVVHVAGGRTTQPERTLASHLKLAPGGAWATEAELLTARYAPAGAVAQGSWYVFGGGAGGGFLTVFTATDAVEIYQP